MHIPAHEQIGLKKGQEDFFLLLQTLPTFWAEWIVTLKFFIYWISWLPEFQIFRFPDLTGLGLGVAACKMCMSRLLSSNVSCIVCPMGTAKKRMFFPLPATMHAQRLHPG